MKVKSGFILRDVAGKTMVESISARAIVTDKNFVNGLFFVFILKLPFLI